MGKEEKNNFNLYAYSLEIGFRISVPLLIFILAGIYADNKFGTGYTFLLLGIGFSLVTSAYGIKKTIDSLKENN